MTDRIAELADIVDTAAKTANAIPQLSASGEITLDEAYEIQRASIARRLARGEKRVGLKMGFTSRAKMVQMGVDDVIWGRLTDAMMEEDGGPVSRARFVHPRVEPEVAFLLNKPLSGKVTQLEAMNAVEAVAPALEIIDSRYENFKFSLTDVVADNSSSSGFVVGPWSKPGTDLTNLGLVMSFDGRPVETGSTAAILGNPVRSLVAAARLSGEAGEPLEPGWIVMAGGATAAAALSVGVSVTLEMQALGRCGFKMEA